MQGVINLKWLASAHELDLRIRNNYLQVLYSYRGFAGRPLELKWLPFYRFSWDFIAFSAILRVNSVGRSIAKTIVTILI